MPKKRVSMTMAREQQEEIRRNKLIYLGFSEKTSLSDIDYLLLCSDLMKKTINVKQEIGNQ